MEADNLARWLSSRISHEFKIREPFNIHFYLQIAGTLIALVAGIVIALPHVIRFMSNRRLWAAISIVSCLMFTSGYVWNTIRGPQFTGYSNGNIEWIAGGFSNQFAVETQIMAVLCRFFYKIILLDSACAFCLVNLVARIPNISNVHAQRMAIYMTLIMMIGVYSVILYMFRRKNSGYPFRLLI